MSARLCVPAHRIYRHLLHKYQPIISQSKRLLKSSDGNEPGRNITNKLFSYRVFSPWKTEEELVDHMCDNVFYAKDNFIGITKPSGLIMRHLPMKGIVLDDVPESADLPLVQRTTLKNILPAIEKKLKKRIKDIDELYLTYAVERNMSGILLFASTDEARKRLIKWFRSVLSERTQHLEFSVITVGLPPAREEREIFFVRRGILDNRPMSFSAEVVDKSAFHGGPDYIRPLITYKVLDFNRETTCALLRVKTNIAKWEALQVYFISKLCRILGDHVYSSRISTVIHEPQRVDPLYARPAPQILSYDIIKALGVSRKRTHEIPLHIHLNSHLIQFRSGKVLDDPIIIRSPLPDYFKRTLERLSLSVPNESDEEDNEMMDRNKFEL